MSNIYVFTIENKNGDVTKLICPCDNWMEAYKIKNLIMKSKNIESVMFVNKLFSCLEKQDGGVVSS